MSVKSVVTTYRPACALHGPAKTAVCLPIPKMHVYNTVTAVLRLSVSVRHIGMPNVSGVFSTTYGQTENVKILMYSLTGATILLGRSVGQLQAQYIRAGCHISRITIIGDAIDGLVLQA
jgi:hypothetical protein